MTAPRPIALIPAYKPAAVLPDIAAVLLAGGAFEAVICVDDGGGEPYTPLFRRLEDMGVVVLRHAVNLGKGQALKTGFNHALLHWPDSPGVVTLDADGQHLPEDAASVARALVAEPDHLVLGSRSFTLGTSGIPWRSRWGNLATCWAMRLFTGLKVSDTQTGLRGVPMTMLPALLRLKTMRYEYEMDMLLLARRHNIPLREVPIRTVYEQGNPTSNFNPLWDSMRIYFMLLRFSSVSLLTAVLDYALFAGLILAFPLWLALAAARVTAAVFQFVMSARYVFFAHGTYWPFLLRYALVFVFIAFLAYGGIFLLTQHTPLPVLAAKALVEMALFFVSFLLQREFVFKPRG